MLILIIGTPDSGKSQKAEQLVLERSLPENRIYLATMLPFGEQGRERVEKHRQMRAGKGFWTIEAPFDADQAVLKLDDPTRWDVLLECVSNLTANELFERGTTPEETVKRVTGQIRRLAAAARSVTAVTNHFEIEETFDEETRVYAETLDRINEMIREMADETIEVCVY
ncbi:MAG: bifunctional adenosylcobinamide kinase/adenosylcobinamide-phosphate guanylyltransferase [Mogibacterium sp.]|nr:bifunctional adenosylcobinamide kinase/adenosylcobinamide-phosphate guanylyltransferase [Mogibacterium sp.]